MRVVWFLLNLGFWTLYIGTVTISAGILRRPNTPGGIFDWCSRSWCRGILNSVNPPTAFVHFDRIPNGQPVVFVSNHQSWFDIFLLCTHLPGRLRFVAKKELLRVPFLGASMKAAEHIFIDRQNRQAAFSAYDAAAQTIRKGMSAVVFPEGTRSASGELIPFKKGPFVLSIAAKVPVVPIYCAGTADVLGKGSIWVKRRPVAILVGPPIPTEALEYGDRTALMDRTREAIEVLRHESVSVLAGMAVGPDTEPDLVS